MIESLIFSSRIVLPSFIMIAIGKCITYRTLLSKSDMDKIGRLTFKYLLSTKIFLDIAMSEPSNFFRSDFVLFSLTATIATFVASWAIGSLLIARKESVPSFVQSCYRSSFTVLGLTMVSTYAGSDGVAKAAPLLAATVILANVLACIVLTKRDSAASMRDIVCRTAISIIKNPLVIAVALGLIVSNTGVRFPYLMDTTLRSLGGMSTTLSLLCIGSSLDIKSARDSFRYAFSAACVKSWGSALIFLPLAASIGFRGFELTTIAIYLTAANPAGCYVMALATDNDAPLAASAIVISTAMCVFTSMAAIAILKHLTLI